MQSVISQQWLVIVKQLLGVPSAATLQAGSTTALWLVIMHRRTCLASQSIEVEPLRQVVQEALMLFSKASAKRLSQSIQIHLIDVRHIWLNINDGLLGFNVL